MGKTLVLAEKPSVGRDIAKVLNCTKNTGGSLEGQRYVVTWALGHLVTLADPEAYDNKYKQWRLEDLPMLPNYLKLVVIKETSKQFSVVRNIMKRSDIDELVIATDAGREGELVARWIMEKAGWNKPTKRLWISSQTEKAVKDGFNNLKPASQYNNLYHSAQCRAEADWLVGLNVTRALTCKYNAQLSAGRVQTPTLKMIVERENEIRTFVPKDYYTISAKSGNINLAWRDRKTSQTSIFKKELADEIVKKTNSGTGRVTEVKKDLKKEPSPQLYDLTELQRDANRKYEYSAKMTLKLMQSLYETHKLLTYPRTDSRFLTSDIVPTLPERLRSICVGNYAEHARRLLKSKIIVSKRIVDDSKVNDHGAIIPTEQHVELGSLNNDEKHIYDLVVKRFLAVLSPAHEYEQLTVNVDINGEMFSVKGKTVKSLGWKAVYSDNDQETVQVLPDIKNGQELKIDNVRSINGKTKPPARYTEATLLTAMEHPGKFIDNEEMREIMDNSSGLGTPATRADIIEKLFSSFNVERNGRELIPTSKGKQLIDLVPSDLKSPELTAKWEQQLTLISKGKENPKGFVSQMRDYASKLVGNVIAEVKTFKYDNVTRNKCPECGKYLLEVNGKKGKMLVCPDRDCGYRKGISMISNARCPNCHKKMELRGDGENKIFVCSCGYREKLSVFSKRRDTEKSNMNKKEISSFMRKQDTGEPINNALAEALAKLKL